MTGKTVSYAANGNLASGYLSESQAGTGIGVIVIQEWWGLVDHIKDICDRLAVEGFTALAPDLYHGQTTKSPDEAGKMLMALNISETEKNLRGAVDYLASLPSVSSQKVGAIGFCMGGQLALYAATINSKVGATVNFYGIHPNVKPDYSQLAGPVLGIFGANDKTTPPEVVNKLVADVQVAGKSIEAHTYPDMPHAFFNDTRPTVYNEAAARDAWHKTLAFLRSNL